MTATDVPARPDLHAVRGPYQGLMPYTEDRHRFFFGRSRDIALIASNVRAYRFCLLYGLSGVGKSSVLQAGVVRSIRDETALRRVHFDDEPVETVVAYLKDWRDDPVAALWAAVLAGFRHEGLSVPADAPVPHDVSAALESICNAHDVDVVMILDQFEEFFLYHSPSVPDFARLLAKLTAPQARANVLIAMREDALSRLDEFEGIVPAVFEHTLRLEHLDEDSARAAIVEPLRTFNEEVPEADRREIEPALVGRLLSEVRAGQVQVDSTQDAAAGAAAAAARAVRGPARIEAPFLQLVLTRLWDEESERGSRVLRSATLESLGGAQAIVSQHLDRVMAAFTSIEQAVLTDAFGHLVTPSGSKIAHRPSDLAAFSEHDPAVVSGLLRRLAEGDQRILREVPPPLDQPQAEPRYEIFHDVLALAVLDWRRRFLTAREQADLVAANERAEAERRETARRLRKVRAFAMVMGALLVLCLVLALVAWRATGEANENRRSAVQSRTSADLARKLVEFNRSVSSDPSAALAKAMDFDFEEGSDPDGGYQEAFRRAFGAADADVRLQLHSPVNYAGFAGADNDKVVAATEDGHVRAWTVDDTGPVRLEEDVAFDVMVTDGDQGRLVGAFLADAGRFLVVLTDANTVSAVDMSSGEVRRLDHQFSDGASVAFSPTGASPRVAAWDYSGDIVVWDVAANRVVDLPDRRYERLDGASLDESGRRLVVASGLTVEAWDLDTGRLLRSREITSHIDTETVSDYAGLQVAGVGFTARDNGVLVLGIGNYTEASYWDIGTDTMTPLGRDYTWRTVVDHADVYVGGVHYLAVAGDKGVTLFDDDGTYVTQTPNANDFVTEIETHPTFSSDFVVGTNEGYSSLYRTNLYPPTADSVFRGQTAPVTGLSFASDGANFVTSSVDGSVRIWRMPSAEQQWYISDWIVGSEFTPDGRYHFGFTPGGTVVREDREGKLISRFPTVAGLLTGMSPSPDGARAAVIQSYCQLPVVVPMVKDAPALDLISPTPATCANALGWNPDPARRQLVAGTYENSLVAWDTETGQVANTMSFGDATSEVHDIAISSDGAVIAVASGSGAVGQIHLVDADSFEEITSWQSQDVTWLDISADGSFVATVSNPAHEVVVWDTGTGKAVQTFEQLPAGTLSRVSISPDDDASRIALSTSTGSVYVWSRTSGKLLGLLRHHSDAANQVAFDTDDIDRLVSAGDDGMMMSYTCEVCSLDADELKEAAEDRLAQVIDLDEG